MNSRLVAEPLLIGFSEMDGVRILVIKGELDLSNYAEIGKQFESEYVSKQSWIIDLTGVKYIESLPIKSIFNCCKMVTDNSGVVGVVCTHGGIVERVFKLVGIGTIYPLFFDLTTAFNHIKET